MEEGFGRVPKSYVSGVLSISMNHGLRIIPNPGTGPGRQITVSRNVLAYVPDMSVMQTNTIIAIMDGLYNCMQFGPAYVGDNMQEIVLPIPYQVVGKTHDPEKILEMISNLMRLQVKYAFAVPGADTEVVSNLISSVFKKNGKFFVAIPPAALPFYLFCGHSVGFAKAERDVLLAFSSNRQKYLYLAMAEKVDIKTKRGVLRLPLDDFSKFGLPENCSAAAIKQKLIAPFQNKLKECRSALSFELKTHYVSSCSRGRPRIDAFEFVITMDKSSSESDDYIHVYNYLKRMLDLIQAPKLSAMQVADTLQNMGAMQDFIAKISRFMNKHDNCNKHHQANTVRRILNDDYEIEI